MGQTFALSLLGGLLAGNGFPHFVRGITKQQYPCALGNGPLANFMAGWAGLVLGTAVLTAAHLATHPLAAFIGVSAGVLLIGLFHAGPGAFGQAEPVAEPEAAVQPEVEGS